MNIKITYRKGAKPIIVEVETKNKTIREIAKDAARQLTKKYTGYQQKIGNPTTERAAKRYEIGQEYMIMEKLEELIK